LVVTSVELKVDEFSVLNTLLSFCDRFNLKMNPCDTIVNVFEYSKKWLVYNIKGQWVASRDIVMDRIQKRKNNTGS